MSQALLAAELFSYLVIPQKEKREVKQKLAAAERERKKIEAKHRAAQEAEAEKRRIELQAEQERLRDQAIAKKRDEEEARKRREDREKQRKVEVSIKCQSSFPDIRRDPDKLTYFDLKGGKASRKESC